MRDNYDINPVHPRPFATPWFKYLLANSTGAPDADVADDVYLGPTIGDVLTNRPIDMSGFRGLAILPFGNGAADTTFTIQLQHVEAIGGGPPNFPSSADSLVSQFIVRDFTLLTATIAAGVNVGQATGYITDTDDFADILTQARATFGTQVEAAFTTTSILYSPTGDVVPAMYWIPDFGNADYAHLLFDITGGGGASVLSANALIKLFT